MPHGPGPKSTPVFRTGGSITIGMTGVVTAWDAATGKQVWQKPGDTQNMPQFTSHAFSPLVDRGLVIFHLGGNAGGAFTAFDVNTGAEKWSWKGDGPGYGSPVVADFGGTRQIIAITQKTLVSVDAATGAVLWERPWVSPNVTNSITPGRVRTDRHRLGQRRSDDRVLRHARRATSGWWSRPGSNADIPMRMSNPVLVGDTLYGMSTRNAGQYFAVDAKTRQDAVALRGPAGRQCGAGHAHIRCSSASRTTGSSWWLRASQTAFELVKRYKLADTATWTQGVVFGQPDLREGRDEPDALDAELTPSFQRTVGAQGRDMKACGRVSHALATTRLARLRLPPSQAPPCQWQRLLPALRAGETSERREELAFQDVLRSMSGRYPPKEVRGQPALATI